MKNFIPLLAIILCLIIPMAMGCKKEEKKSDITYDNVIDNDGNVIKTIQIGTQTWMAQDLTSITFQNGDTVPFIAEQKLWNDTKLGAFCNYQTYYKENPFGRLYNWYIVMDPRNICPEGWHIPNNDDWNKLISEIGSSSTKLKESSINYWNEWTYDNTNETGFTAIPNGVRTQYSIVNNNKLSAAWWSSTPQNDFEGWLYYLAVDNNQVSNRPEKKIWGVSIRCVKN